MNRFNFRITAALVAMGTFLAGCNSGSSDTTTVANGGTTATTEPQTKSDTTSTDGSSATEILTKDGRKAVVGFSQIGAESAWRTANTKSIQEEAAKRGVELKFSDAQQKQENQIKAIRSFIAQGVDVIAFAPVVETGWKQVLEEARDAKIPVIVSDRRPDVPEDLYVTFIGSDFVEEGRMAAEWLAKKMNGKAVIAELTGTPGSAPANDRKKGFAQELAKHPDMTIAFSQTGEFTRSKGKEVMEALLKSPTGAKVNALYAHNDDMALGAIQAIEEAGKKPGEDIIIISIDGVKGAFEAMVAGKLNCTVECNPLLGPMLFDAIAATLAGKELPKRTVIKDGIFDQAVAAKEMPNRKY
ncbi:MAG: ABC transporter periplasmic-binding protein YtfQ [Fimbriimonadaceae bacterium]|nr:ABC transporter periplasmic-binding protein YtfQ [Fimbriimonadaceae bacterium]